MDGNTVRTNLEGLSPRPPRLRLLRVDFFTEPLGALPFGAEPSREIIQRGGGGGAENAEK